MVSGQALTDESALGVGDGQLILIGDDSIPQGSDIANLLVRREVIETGRGNREGVCHVDKNSLCGSDQRQLDLQTDDN